MKTKSKISGHIIRGGAWAVFLSVAFIALSSASNSPNTWHKSAGTLASMTQRLRLRVNPGRSASQQRVAYQRAIEDVYWRHRI